MAIYQGRKLISGTPNFTEIETQLNNKVDKIQGKGLSTNDFTNEDKSKLDNLKQGTIVTVGGVSQETWNADTKANMSDIPTKTSQLENDSNFISTVPQATTKIGGIRANPKTELDTTEVRIDSNTGYLYCSGGGSGGGDLSSKQDKPTNNTTVYGFNSGNYQGTDTFITAIGSSVLSKNMGRFNTGIGFGALTNNTDGTNNTSVGTGTLYNNKTGNNNTVVGDESLAQNVTGTNNTVVGYNSLNSTLDNITATNINNATVLGANASVSGDNQVQLGDSQTTTYCFGAIQNRSDRRDKADIKKTTLGLSFINSLRPVEFKWDYRDDYFKDELQKDGTIKRVPIPKDGSKKRNRYHQGFIAQEVKEVTDNLNVDFGGYQDHSINGGCDVLSLGYEEFIAPIVKSIQEQQQIIENQNKKIEMLETKLNEILAK